jgi:stage V sporulation protein S
MALMINAGMRETMDVIKVKAVSRTAGVAGAIAGVMREKKYAEVQAIGAGAVNQAVKALVLAKNFLEQDGIEVIFKPEFVNVEIDDKVRTAIKFVVEPRFPEAVIKHPETHDTLPEEPEALPENLEQG